ncbi:MAG: branched-chain amino acid ABC transporter permease [Chloroflexi bacterium]|nr:branched-chain amino acid ABC transporter permease [Chloroflexota bacterium]
MRLSNQSLQQYRRLWWFASRGLAAAALVLLITAILTAPSGLQNLFNGLAVGSVYAIFALGYTLIFSILRIINFTHGAIFTLGAYFTYFLTGASVGFNGLLANQRLPFGLPFPIAMIGGGLLAGLCGILIERVAFRPLRNKGADPLLTLVSSLGVAVAIVNVIQLLVGAEIYSYPRNPFGEMPAALNLGTFGGLSQRPVVIRTIQVIIFAVSMATVVLLTYFVNGTKIGKALRAVAEDATTSSLLGINTNFLISLTFFISGLIGGIAGTLVGLSVNVSGPYFGINFGLKGLAVIVLGGLGDIPGAVVGGLVIGVAEAFVPSEHVAYKEAIAFAVLFLVLLLRPQGLLGRAAVQKV